MKTLIFLLLTFTFCSCKTNFLSQDEISNSIFYFKDKRTNVCFASIYSITKDGYQVVSITHVPCENVKHLIK